MSSDGKLQEVIQHFKFAIQATMETDMGGVDPNCEDWQTLLGLYLQSQLTALSEMDEEKVREEFNFFLSRPTSKIQGLIL